MPLADPLLARIDNAMRISVPVIRSWASYHRIGAGLNVSYALLMPLLVLAIFAPALAGKVQPAREFVIANLIAIAIGAPLFALLPAVGPWYSYHFAPTSDQALCQIQLLAARTPGPYIYTSAPAHIVSFPSFHVLWAILCARALWGFRYFRLPLALLSGMIIVSTMTTGWHYATDVIGGLILAAISISIAYRIT
ncbi:MAG TPA: phosphatase PAP2 family protein [Edaphobacter sp.]|nr:phosphatase PAP2 family protein [Edaphobacter sp.]